MFSMGISKYLAGGALGLATLFSSGDKLEDAARKAYNSFFHGTGKETAMVLNKSQSPLEESLSGVAYGGERVSIDKFYETGYNSDTLPLAKGHKFGEFGISTSGIPFYEDEWDRYYLDNKDGKGEEIQKIFKELDGKLISVDYVSYRFNFETFHNYWVNNRGKVKNLRFCGSYLGWVLPKEKEIIYIPMDKDVMNRIAELFPDKL